MGQTPQATSLTLGHRLLDDYLAMMASRCRPNTVLATAFDPAEVTNADVLAFIRVQRQPRRGVEAGFP